MTASIVRFERSASSQSRSPSTKIDSGAFPSRTSRACRSRELSQLLIVILNSLPQRHGEESHKKAQNAQKSGDRSNEARTLFCASCAFLWLPFFLSISLSLWRSFRVDLRPN